MPEETDSGPEPLPDVIPPWVEKPQSTTLQPVPAKAPTPSHPVIFTPPTVEQLQGTIPGYELLLLFFSDSRTALYRAWQANLERDVAIKILPPIPSYLEPEEYITNFEEEARIMARLSHTNIVKVYEFGTTATGLPYFVMEYVEGAILGPAIRSGQMTLDHVVSWVPQICKALQYAHQMGIVHGDVRPENILLTQKGDVKLINFGLSRVHGQGPEAASLNTNRFSAKSAGYMAPELRKGEGPIDYRADIYSLGAVIYEMLYGVLLPPGAWELPSEKLGMDARFDEILIYSLSPVPDERFQSAMDISVRLLDMVNNP